MLGEFQDRNVLVPLGQPLEGMQIDHIVTTRDLKSYISKWIGKVIDNVTKEAFHGYHSNQLSVIEMKVFVCNHIILSFHAMMEYVR
jgi:hypothetical protein